jgi:hypothetical protein
VAAAPVVAGSLREAVETILAPGGGG